MENINERLQTIPPKRQEQFHRILANNTRIFSPKTETDKQKIIELTQSKLLKYLANEEKEKLVGRKHGSKGNKHRERGPQQIKRIEKKLEENKINYPLFLKEVFDVTLREKHSHKGIRYIGLCPFHDEKTPSLSVAPDIGVIKCYGCGKGHRPTYLLTDVFGIKPSRALGMLEKYIYTPEEMKEWEKKNQLIMDILEISPEQEEKKDFVRYLIHRERYNDSPYFPKKQFEAEFIKRKKEKERKKNEKGDEEDVLPF
ncbi:MAG: CHC2 zinc finger domain-containing protein [Candidatus Absconditabacterales bacterium]